MTAAGIDTSHYKSHTTRTASTSHLASKHFDLKNIMLAAGWSREETFQRFYNFTHNNTFNFGSAIMDTLSLLLILSNMFLHFISMIKITS